MLIYAFLLILVFRPSWGLLHFFVILAAALWAAFGLTQWHEQPMALALAVMIQGTIFYGVGALIVAVRKWMLSRKSGDERRAEKLVAEARAEASKQPQ